MIYLRVILTLALILATYACAKTSGGGGGTTTGNPMVELSFAGFDDNLGQEKLSAFSTVEELSLCFKRLRFKGQNIENVDLKIGEVELDPDGTPLSMVSLSEGHYNQVEFDLAPDCPNKKSLIITNSHGQFSTEQNFVIRFEGDFNWDGSSEKLELFISRIIKKLEDVQSNSEIRSAAESASGRF